MFIMSIKTRALKWGAKKIQLNFFAPLGDRKNDLELANRMQAKVCLGLHNSPKLYKGTASGEVCQ